MPQLWHELHQHILEIPWVKDSIVPPCNPVAMCCVNKIDNFVVYHAKHWYWFPKPVYKVRVATGVGRSLQNYAQPFDAVTNCTLIAYKSFWQSENFTKHLYIILLTTKFCHAFGVIHLIQVKLHMFVLKIGVSR